MLFLYLLCQREEMEIGFLSSYYTAVRNTFYITPVGWYAQIPKWHIFLYFSCNDWYLTC
jgi:hypothetical protein